MFPLYIISVIALGFLFGPTGRSISAWTVPILAVQMFLMALSVRLDALIAAFKQPKYLIIWIVLAWGVVPAISFGLGRLFLAGYPEFAAGLVLTTSLPAAVTANVWTGISRGNLPLALTTVGAASILSGVMTPLVLNSWVGVLVELDTGALIYGFLVSVLLPTVAGVIMHEMWRQRVDNHRITWRLSAKLLIGLVVFINAAVLQPQLHRWGWSAAAIIVLVVAQAVFAYGIAFLVVSKVRGASRADVVALTYSVGMRNNSAGIVIGMTFFGPAVAAPVILSILIQQPLASLVHRYVFRRNDALVAAEH